MKKIVALISVALLCIASLGMSVFADDGSKTVTLRIEGVAGTYCDKTVTTSASTVYDLLTEVDASDDSFECTITSSTYGPYLTTINGDSAGTYGDWSGWMFLVNGVAAPSGMDSTALADKDEVVFYFSDQYGVGFQFPIIDSSDIANGIIKLTSNDKDASYNPVVNPVAGATVRFYTTDTDYVEYVSDAEGKVNVETTALTQGTHKVTIAKYADSGLPLVLRTVANVDVAPAAGDAMNVLPYAVIMLIAATLAGILMKKKVVNA